MNFKLRPILPEDREAVTDIYNSYVENSFAAYAENKLPYEHFDIAMQKLQGYPTVAAISVEGKFLGSGTLRAYRFPRAAEISYFIHPDHRRMGIGSAMLEYLIGEAKQRGIISILASISSKNEPSIAFHAKNGFEQVGCLRSVGLKKGQPFDEILMQRMI